MKTFCEIFDGKPTKALRALIKGLYRQNARTDFKINMGTFGKIGHEDGKPICYGCAATCVVQEAYGINFYADDFRGRFNHSVALKHDLHDLIDFENSIDSFRSGNLLSLLTYFNVYWMLVNKDEADKVAELDQILEYARENVYMTGNNWEDVIPAIGHIIVRLESIGL